VHDALTDLLTGLAHRRSFDVELPAVAAGAERSSPAHLVLADIDHFKRVNDTHAHDTGDEILRIVGEILLGHVRGGSLVARLGGDEFGLLLPGASPHYTAGIATRLCELLASRALVVRGFPEVSARVTLSIGGPRGMPARAVPNGTHAPMRRCTKRSAAAATASASLARSSLSFDFAGRCKFRIRSPYISQGRYDPVDHIKYSRRFVQNGQHTYLRRIKTSRRQSTCRDLEKSDDRAHKSKERHLHPAFLFERNRRGATGGYLYGRD
jgi:diguanylate cyclase (GGDEF)-like protein